jgi:hypothetical protein
MTDVLELQQTYSASQDPGANANVNAGNLDAQVLAVINKLNELNRAVSRFLRDDNTPADESVPLRALKKEIITILAAETGWQVKATVRAAATGNVLVSNPGTAVFDGVTLSNGDRLALCFQSAAAENGIYVFNGSGVALTRATDADVAGELALAYFQIEQGAAYSGATALVTNTKVTTLGTDALTVVVFTASVVVPGSSTVRSISARFGDLALANVAALRALSAANLPDKTPAFVLGYTAANDGGGGRLYWDSASSAADNGWSIFLPTGYVGVGRWKRVIEGAIQPAWGGAGLGGGDDTAMLNAIISGLAAGSVVDFGARTYTLASASLNALSGRAIAIPADRITLRGNGAKLVLSGTADCGIFDSSGRNYIAYEGIAFVGNNRATLNTVNYGMAINHTGTGAAADMYGLYVRRCRFQDFAGPAAVYVASLTTTFNLHEIVMEDCEMTGGDTITPLNGGWFSSLITIGTNTAGEVQDITINGNFVYGPKLKLGIALVGNNGAIRYGTIIGNTIHDVGTYYAANGGVTNSYGINLKPNCYDIVCKANVIKSTAQIGIYSNLGFRHAIEDNIIEDIQDTNDGTLMRGAIVCGSPGSTIVGNTTYNVIWGCQLQACPDTLGRSDIVVSGNTFTAKQPLKLRYNPNGTCQGLKVSGNQLTNTDATYACVKIADNGATARWDEVSIVDNDIIALQDGIKNTPGLVNSGWRDLRIEHNRIKCDTGRGISFDGDQMLNYSVSFNDIVCTANSTFGIYVRNGAADTRGRIKGNRVRDNTNPSGRAFELYQARATLDGNEVINCTNIVQNISQGTEILGFHDPAWSTGATLGDKIQLLEPYTLLGGMRFIGWEWDGSVWKKQYITNGLLVGAAIWDPPNVNAAATTTTTITVTGAVVGMYVQVAPPYDLQGIVATAYVSAADTVTVVLFNPTAGAINLASGTWRVRATPSA